MSSFHDVSMIVCSRVPQLIHDIDKFSLTEPWSGLASDDRANSLPEVAEHACALALRGGRGQRRCARLLESAAHHGLTRRQQGLPESIIFEEIALVREAIWADIQARFGRESRLAAEIILRIDMALTLASQASLRGYFRDEFESRGLWPEVLAELAAAWHPPRLPGEKARNRVKRRLLLIRTRPKRRFGEREHRA